MRSLNLAAAVLTAAALLSGCASKVASSEQYSGFLNAYGRLERTQTASGHEVLRWIDPTYKESNYRGIFLAPVVYYPEPKPTQRLSAQSLDRIKAYTDERIRNAIGQRLPLVARPHGQRLLNAEIAITAVSAENEGMAFYEFLPIGAVIAGSMAASGYRSQHSVLLMEVRVRDQDTGEVVIEAVRKGFGKSVSNDSKPITLEEIQSAVDDIVADIAGFPRQG